MLARVLVLALGVAVRTGTGTGTGPVTCGSVVKLLNVRHNVRLHSHDVRYGSGNRTSFPFPSSFPASEPALTAVLAPAAGSGQQSVTGVSAADDGNSYWRVRARTAGVCERGAPVRCGQSIRLTHLGTGRNLHSHHFASPLSGNQVPGTAATPECTVSNGSRSLPWALLGPLGPYRVPFVPTRSVLLSSTGWVLHVPARSYLSCLSPPAPSCFPVQTRFPMSLPALPCCLVLTLFALSLSVPPCSPLLTASPLSPTSPPVLPYSLVPDGSFPVPPCSQVLEMGSCFLPNTPVPNRPSKSQQSPSFPLSPLLTMGELSTPKSPLASFYPQNKLVLTTGGERVW